MNNENTINPSTKYTKLKENDPIFLISAILMRFKCFIITAIFGMFLHKAIIPTTRNTILVTKCLLTKSAIQETMNPI